MKKMIGSVLAAVLVLSLTGCGDNAGTTGNGSSAAEQSSAAENMQTEKPEERAGSVEIRDGNTVYVKTLADGSVEEGGLPLALKVTYELDGQIVDADGIEGRSGHLKMIFDYENLTSFETEHDGRKVNVKAPVAAALMLMLDDEIFTGVSAENAKVSSVSDRSMIMGFVLPGLAESLALDGWESTEDADIPESITVEADVADFKMDLALTIAEVLDLSDLKDEDLDELEDLSEGMKDLDEAGGELADAADELSDGAGSLRKGIGAYLDGVQKVADAVAAAAGGAKPLMENGAALVSGAEALSGGISQLGAMLSQYAPDPESSDPRDQLILGLQQAVAGFESGARELTDGAAAYTGGVNALCGGLTELADGAGALTPAGDEIRRGLKELKNGTSEFADEIREFYEDGISKLTERTGEGFDEIVLRLRAVREAAASYSYPGIDGEARFIYEVTY